MAHCYSLSCLETAMRNNNQPLFPSPSEGKRYFIRADVHKQIGFLDSRNSELSVEWNHTIEAFFSEVTSTCKIPPIILFIDMKSV